MRIHLRAVDRFMTARRPACSLRQPGGVVRIADKNSTRDRLLLEMTL